MNYQPVYLWFCHLFVKFMVPQYQIRRPHPKTAMELDAVNQGGRPFRINLTMESVGRKDTAPTWCV